MWEWFYCIHSIHHNPRGDAPTHYLHVVFCKRHTNSLKPRSAFTNVGRSNEVYTCIIFRININYFSDKYFAQKSAPVNPTMLKNKKFITACKVNHVWKKLVLQMRIAAWIGLIVVAKSGMGSRTSKTKPGTAHANGLSAESSHQNAPTVKAQGTRGGKSLANTQSSETRTGLINQSTVGAQSSLKKQGAQHNVDNKTLEKAKTGKAPGKANTEKVPILDSERNVKWQCTLKPERGASLFKPSVEQTEEANHFSVGMKGIKCELIYDENFTSLLDAILNINRGGTEKKITCDFDQHGTLALFSESGWKEESFDKPGTKKTTGVPKCSSSFKQLVDGTLKQIIATRVTVPRESRYKKTNPRPAEMITTGKEVPRDENFEKRTDTGRSTVEGIQQTQREWECMKTEKKPQDSMFKTLFTASDGLITITSQVEADCSDAELKSSLKSLFEEFVGESEAKEFSCTGNGYKVTLESKQGWKTDPHQPDNRCEKVSHKLAEFYFESFESFNEFDDVPPRSTLESKTEKKREVLWLTVEDKENNSLDYYGENVYLEITGGLNFPKEELTATFEEFQGTENPRCKIRCEVLGNILTLYSKNGWNNLITKKCVSNKGDCSDYAQKFLQSALGRR